eukprot:4119583-Prymnesium_polylepis.1
MAPRGSTLSRVSASRRVAGNASRSSSPGSICVRGVSPATEASRASCKKAVAMQTSRVLWSRVQCSYWSTVAANGVIWRPE